MGNRAHFTGLEDQLKSSTGVGNDLARKLAELQKALDDANGALGDANGRIRDLESANAALDDQLGSAKVCGLYIEG